MAAHNDPPTTTRTGTSVWWVGVYDDDDGGKANHTERDILGQNGHELAGGHDLEDGRDET